MTLREFEVLLDENFNQDQEIFITKGCGCTIISDVNHGDNLLRIDTDDKSVYVDMEEG